MCILNFKNWLNEGFYIDYTKLPTNLHPGTTSFDISYIPKKKSLDRRQIINDFHKKIDQLINFDEKDQEDHFIKTEFINKLEEITIKDSQRLRSFRSRILYGMKFDMNKEKIKIFISSTIMRLEEAEKDLKEKIQILNTKFNKKDHDIVIEKAREMAYKGLTIDKIIEMIPKMADMPKNLNSEKVKKIIEKQKYLSENPEIKLGTLQRSLKTLKSELAKISEDKKEVSNWHNLIQQVFLKKVKHPTSTGDQTLSDKFVNLSVENFVKFKLANNYYDIILYPESSSDVNRKIAEGLSRHFGCEAMLGFNKRKIATIDVHNFIKKHRDSGFDVRDAMANLRGQLDNSNNQIKNIRINQAFIRNWEINFNEKEILKNIKNKRVLVIDDNYRTGGTLQSINKVLWNIGGPKTVDYYVPLYANFS